jgi:hypothetical protein
MNDGLRRCSRATEEAAHQAKMQEASAAKARVQAEGGPKKSAASNGHTASSSAPAKEKSGGFFGKLKKAFK